MRGFLKNQMGAIKGVKAGFSWTYFFFGLWVPLFRGDFKWFILSLLLFIITLGIAHIVLSFTYNKVYINGLINKGYRPDNENFTEYLRFKGIFIPESE